MSPIVMPVAAPSPLAGQSYPQQVLLPSPVGQPPMVVDYRTSPIRPSVSGRPADDLMYVENRAPSESIAQLFSDFPQRGPAASVATFDMLAGPRGPGAPPNSRPPAPVGQHQTDRHLAEFYGTTNGQPVGGLQHSSSGQLQRGSVVVSGAGTGTNSSSNSLVGGGPSKRQPAAAPAPQNASVLGMLKSKLSGL